ncbi:MAG: hypothetical protein EOO73_04885 [Myxococcales bacterium]|nr:MAG: hypothetical protein EOO73_04885 [Myxococcales bacterium]
MAKRLLPLAVVGALYLASAGCNSDDQPGSSFTAGASVGGSDASSGAGPVSAGTGGTAGRGGTAAVAGAASGGGVAASGSAGGASAGGSSAPPPDIDGRSIYSLECHGDSRDCHLGAVPCFGVASEEPNVAAGWACANRCETSADCSKAPSGAAAQASCVSFASKSHCVLVCENENESFACPTGMSCYTPPKSPVGYCLWP